MRRHDLSQVRVRVAIAAGMINRQVGGTMDGVAAGSATTAIREIGAGIRDRVATIKVRGVTIRGHGATNVVRRISAVADSRARTNFVIRVRSAR